MRNSRAFSQVELLIVIAIIALLIAILMPALSQARQQARNVQDLSNLKQLGIAAWTWAEEHDQRSVPANWYENEELARITHVRLPNAYSPSATFTDQQRNNLYACPLATKIDFFGSNPPDIISYGINGELLRDSMTGGNQRQDDFKTAQGIKLDMIKEPTTTNHFMCHEKWVVLKYLNFYPAIDPALLPDPTRTRWHRICRGRFYGKSNMVWLDGHVSAEPEDFEQFWERYLNVKM